MTKITYYNSPLTCEIRILSLLAELPGDKEMDISGLAKAIKYSRLTTRKHLDSMERDGLVHSAAKNRGRRHVYYSIAPLGAELATYYMRQEELFMPHITNRKLSEEASKKGETTPIKFLDMLVEYSYWHGFNRPNREMNLLFRDNGETIYEFNFKPRPISQQAKEAIRLMYKRNQMGRPQKEANK